MRMRQKRVCVYHNNFICGRDNRRKILPVFAVHYSYAHPAFAYLHRLTKLLVTEGENEMKVVVVRSPKLFSGILRLIFGIKRQEQTT
ncbi:MAG TPA: stage V sporulation protein SpoVM [Ruminococcaceae bacterium]|nr:stage V sporulation protein SpoVM [Oscillospiraceae bacterium]HBW72145.1 stage V sporulation protein SpoVM [Oscillospiraceae bacterium]